MQALKDRLTSAGYAFGWTVVRRLPEAWARSIFMLVAEIAWRRQGRGVQQLEANLRRVIGPDATGAAAAPGVSCGHAIVPAVLA